MGIYLILWEKPLSFLWILNDMQILAFKKPCRSPDYSKKKKLLLPKSTWKQRFIYIWDALTLEAAWNSQQC